MTNERRLAVYGRQRGITAGPVLPARLTPAQRRRWIKKARGSK